MGCRSCCSQEKSMRVTKGVTRRVTSLATYRRALVVVLWSAVWIVTIVPRAAASNAPDWMRALVGVSLPSYDEKTDAVLLYSETSVTVLSVDKIRTRVRAVYKILRPEGREHETVFVPFNPGRKITNLHAWCIPAQGKDYEVKEKDAIDTSGFEGYEVFSDVKVRLLRIPAPDPGNIIGYEYELEEQPVVLQDVWDFQQVSPVRESHYSLQLPLGWEYKASWLNHPEVTPTQSGSNQWQWVVSDVKGVRYEEQMPPRQGLQGQMILSFFPSGGATAKGFSNWREMGTWYWNLENGRFAASPEIKQKVAALTALAPTPLDKMKALANFVQDDIRYVAIELGIGGWQPHPASDIFAHRYGDCKDKATLMRTMLREIGVNSFQVAINTERGSITSDTPAYLGFNHQITAIQLPDSATSPSLVATMQHPKLGKILFFDPTDELTPFGQISGALQANYGLLVTPDGGELVELPELPPAMNGIQR